MPSSLARSRMLTWPMWNTSKVPKVITRLLGLSVGFIASRGVLGRLVLNRALCLYWALPVAGLNTNRVIAGAQPDRSTLGGRYCKSMSEL